MTAGVHYYIVTTVLKKYVTGYTPYCKGSIPSPLKPMSPIQLTQSHETPVFDTTHTKLERTQMYENTHHTGSTIQYTHITSLTVTV